MQKEKQAVLLISVVFLIILAFMILRFTKFEYPLTGDGGNHWQIGEAIQQDKTLMSHNVLFPKAPQDYPQGYHLLFVASSNLSGISLQKIFIFMPVILYIFYFCSLYLFAKFVTKNRIIAALSGLSLFLYWTYNVRYHYTVSFFSYAMPEFLNSFLALIIFVSVLKKDKKWFCVASILTFLTSFIHRSTSVALFVFIGFIILFDLIKKDRKEIVKKVFLLLLLISGWSIQFMPMFLNYGLPVSSITAQFSPSETSKTPAPFFNSFYSKLKDEYNFFAMERYFHFGNGFPFTYVWIILIITGLIFILKKRMINSYTLPYFLLPVLHIFATLIFNINLAKNPAYFFFTPIAYFLFSGIGIYYLFFGKKNLMTLIIGVILIILIIPSIFGIIYRVPLPSSDFPGSIRILQGNEHLGISDKAIDFIKNISLDSIVIASPVTSRSIAIITQRKVLHTAYAHYGMYVFDLYNISERHEDIRKIYELCDFNETIELMNKYGRSVYIYVGIYDQATYKICFEKFDKYFEKEDFDKDRIYYVNDLNE